MSLPFARRTNPHETTKVIGGAEGGAENVNASVSIPKNRGREDVLNGRSGKREEGRKTGEAEWGKDSTDKYYTRSVHATPRFVSSKRGPSATRVRFFSLFLSLLPTEEEIAFLQDITGHVAILSSSTDPLTKAVFKLANINKKKDALTRACWRYNLIALSFNII